LYVSPQETHTKSKSEQNEFLNNLMFAGPFWAMKNAPLNFYVPLPLTCEAALDEVNPDDPFAIRTGKITQIWDWQADRKGWYRPDGKHEKRNASRKWVAIEDWPKLQAWSQLQEQFFASNPDLQAIAAAVRELEKWCKSQVWCKAQKQLLEGKPDLQTRIAAIEKLEKWSEFNAWYQTQKQIFAINPDWQAIVAAIEKLEKWPEFNAWCQVQKQLLVINPDPQAAMKQKDWHEIQAWCQAQMQLLKSNPGSPTAKELEDWYEIQAWCKAQQQLLEGKPDSQTIAKVIKGVAVKKLADLLDISVVADPWQVVPHLHPRLESEQRRVDEDLERGSLFLENAVQMHPDTCLIYLSRHQLPTGWYRFGGEGHMVEIESVPIAEGVTQLLKQPVGRRFALVAPAAWGSKGLSYRFPVDKSQQPQPLWAYRDMMTERPQPHRFLTKSPKHDPRFSLGRYQVTAGTVYILGDPLPSWLEWPLDWFPTEGGSYKRWGSGLALPL
jgi:hypothetical protein